MLHCHWRSCPMASHRRVLLSFAALRLVVASRKPGNCSRKNRFKHRFARPRRCDIGLCMPMRAIEREPPVLHGHWRAPHCMALPWLAASRHRGWFCSSTTAHRCTCLCTLFSCCDGEKQKFVHGFSKKRLGILTRLTIPVIT